MMKIRDRFTLGVVGGLVAAIPWRMLNNWERKKGYTELTYSQLAAGLFVPKGAIDDPKAAIVGKIGNQVLLAGTGVATAYLLSVSGRDKAWLKGAGVASLLWLFLYGLATRAKAVTIKPRKANTILLSYLDYAGLGATAGLLISAIGDRSVFPKRTGETDVPRVKFRKQCFTYKENAIPDSTAINRLL
jgi:hypothetical protein